MTCNTVEILEPREDGKFASIGWAGVSCRTAIDWYVTMNSTTIVDHLPNHEAARHALFQYQKDKREGRWPTEPKA